jgi:hypothetical protein
MSARMGIPPGAVSCIDNRDLSEIISCPFEMIFRVFQIIFDGLKIIKSDLEII